MQPRILLLDTTYRPYRDPLGGLLIVDSKSRTTLRALLLVGFAASLYLGLTSCMSPARASAAAGKDLETQEYQRDFAVSTQTAETRLDTLSQGVGLAETLPRSLGGAYAGVWFDHKTGEFVVPLTAPNERYAIEKIAQANGLTGDLRTAPVEATWEELEQSQKVLTESLTRLSEDGLVTTSIDPRRNAVVVHQTEGVGIADTKYIQALKKRSAVPVVIELEPRPQFQVDTRACTTTKPRKCSKPLRGGVSISPQPIPEKVLYVSGTCTAGFKAIGKTFGNRFMLTAGHCEYAFQGLNVTWASELPNFEDFDIGQMEQWTFGPSGDWGKIKANGSTWDTAGWPSMVAHYWEDQEYPIEYEAPSFPGQYVCLSGTNSGTSCGNVIDVHVEGYFDGKFKVNLPPLNEVFGICNEGGDSGGPIFSYGSNTALGIMSAGEDGPGCNDQALYVDIIEATDDLGVSVGARIGSQPIVKTLDPTDINARSAVLNGSVNPNGRQTNYSFDWGTTPEYGKWAGSGSAGGWQTVNLSTPLEGLKPFTTYHYRLSADNTSTPLDTVYGASKQFTTPAIPPKATTGDPVDVTGTTAEILVYGNPEEVQSSLRIEYGTSGAYGSTTPPSDIGANREDKTRVLTVSGLQPLTTYHYRAVATNVAGQTTYGANKTFTTPSLAPIVTTRAATNVGQTSAQLNGTINPQGFATTYRFQYGLTTAYGSSIPVPDGSAGFANGKLNVSHSVGGLAEGATYHYRLVATSSKGTTYGADQLATPGWTLITPPLPQGGTNGLLSSVSCSSPTACMAVGRYTNAGKTNVALAERWNGANWQPVPVPDAGPNVMLSWLLSVSCPADNMCKAVGISYDQSGSGNAYAAHWNGSQWTTEAISSPAQTTTWLMGVACPTVSACEAVGYKTNEAGSYNFSQSWNGAGWKERSAPSVPGAKASLLTGISCTSASMCVASGGYEISAQDQGPLALHWNGAIWELRSPPMSSGFTVGRSQGVSCTSSTFCSATGYQSKGGPPAIALAERWNGTGWAPQAAPYPLTSKASFLMGVSCENPEACLSTGFFEAASGQGVPLGSMWDGTSWEPQAIPHSEGEAVQRLDGVSCKGRACVAVGFNQTFTTSESKPAIARYTIPESAPIAVTDAASKVLWSEALLNATIVPRGLPTTYQFEYGPTTAYGKAMPLSAAGLGSGQTAKTVDRIVTELSPQTTYHFRVVATNSKGTTYGADRTFTTGTTTVSARLGAMAVTEPFNGATGEASSFATDWTALGWTSGLKGINWVAGWGPTQGFPSASGAFYGRPVADAGSGLGAKVKMPLNSAVKDENFSLWLDLQNAATATRNGYRLKFIVTGVNTYTVGLARWQNGQETVLATKTGVSFNPGSSLALVDEGAAITAWTNTGGSFTQLLKAADSAYSGGHAGIEAQGNALRLTDFSVGRLLLPYLSMDAALKSLPVTDAFSVNQPVLSSSGSWTALPWANSTSGHNPGWVSEGWGPYDDYPTVNGAASQKVAIADSGAGDAVSSTLSASPAADLRYVSLWLALPAPLSTRTGYELKIRQIQTTYEVRIFKWQSGASTSLAVKSGVSLPLGSQFALVDKGSSVSVWTRSPSSDFVQLLAASDGAFSGGYVGIEGSGSSTRLTNLRSGPLSPLG